jgi:hypothetical protein
MLLCRVLLPFYWVCVLSSLMSGGDELGAS